ncbi:MAG: mechanosensitive ion channel family protein [Clostridia bacterium]|nr:mechanosensitive ion channel family protein [Clostridia bacterium]
MQLIDEKAWIEFLHMALTAAIILIVGVILAKVTLRILEKFLQKTSLDPMLHKFFKNIAKVILWAVVGITFLDSLGIKATTFLTVFAAAGAAIALALKDSLGNFAGGILILFTKPFSKGDYVECCDVAGMIESIDILYTTILTIDNQVVTIPNGQLTNNTITNYSKQETRRLVFDIGISYESDIAKAKETLLSLVEHDPRVHKTPEPYCIVDGYQDSAVKLSLRAWCSTAEFWNVKWDIQGLIKDSLKAQGISIPYPQLDIQIKQEKRS